MFPTLTKNFFLNLHSFVFYINCHLKRIYRETSKNKFLKSIFKNFLSTIFKSQLNT